MRNYYGDISGQVFGEFTALYPDEEAGHKNPRWVCRCSCGKIVSVRKYALISGQAKNCHAPCHSPYVGKRIGKFVVTEDAIKKNGRYYFKCICDCGNTFYTSTAHLSDGKVLSCGCRRIENNISRSTHHMTETRIYREWCGIKRRCYNKNDSEYHNYGGRGIIMCEEWKNNFVPFYQWAIENGYDDSLSIDRIDVNGNYEPSNCRWATQKIQANNTRVNVYVEYNGERLTLHQLCDKYSKNGVTYDLFHLRYRVRGWDIERALTEPPENMSVTIGNETHSITEWSDINGIKTGTIYWRIKNGWSLEDAVSKPLKCMLIEFNGETHTISEWSKITGFKTGTLYDRLQKGWSVEKSFTAPLGTK